MLGKGASSSGLEIKQTKSRNDVEVIGLTKAPVETMDDVRKLLGKANKNRSVASTSMNEHSSRSHSVFTMHLTGINKSQVRKYVVA